MQSLHRAQSKMFQIEEEEKLKFYQQFGKTPKTVEKDVEIIKDWIKNQPHLPEIMDDSRIRNFLNLTKFSIEKTKNKIDMYYTIRSLMPDIFENSNPKLETVRKMLNEMMYICTHPKPLNGIHRVHFIKCKGPNCMPQEFSKIWFAIFEIRLCEDFMVNDVLVHDWGNVTLADLKKLTPSILSKFLKTYQKVYSLRIKNLIYINCPSYINVFIQVIKPLLKAKIFERIQIYKDDTILKQVLPKDMIPSDYGGEGLSLDELNEMTLRKFDEYGHRFDLLDTLRVDENLRPEKLNNDEILGYYGNFKKIDFD